MRTSVRHSHASHPMYSGSITFISIAMLYNAQRTLYAGNLCASLLRRAVKEKRKKMEKKFLQKTEDE